MDDLEAEAGRPANSRATLARLLDDLLAIPESQDEITAEIEAIFGQERAVLVLDMSGFSRTTRRRGIVTFLTMIHRMQAIAIPAVEAHGGIVIKAEGDNLYCLLDSALAAVHAASDIIRLLTAMNPHLEDHARLYASIGIGYGHIINVADEDMFGDEVNLACKLGEDIGGPGMVLLTEQARAQLGETDIAVRPDAVSISGIELNFYILD